MKWKIYISFWIVVICSCTTDEISENELLFHAYKEIKHTKADFDGENARVWTIKKSDLIRINLVEMTGDLSWHKHPDAEHSLMLLEGSVKAYIGDSIIIMSPNDFISIPKGIPHKYVTISSKALLVSMDAPYYDPQKTIQLE